MLAAAVLPTVAAGLAPYPGTIVGLTQVTLLNGQTVPAVEMETDANAEPFDEPAPNSDDNEGVESLQQLDSASPKDIGVWIDRLRSHGVWADRPGCPNFLAQLDAAAQAVAKPGSSVRGSQAAAKRVDTILCNLLDDEPTMRINSSLAAAAGVPLLIGLRLLAKILAVKNVWIALEAGAPSKWWSTLRRRSRKLGMTFFPLLNDYPQSDPTLMVYSLLRKRLKPGLLPTQQQVMILDAATALAIGRCVMDEAPMLRVPLAIRDHAERQTHLIKVPVGTSLADVLADCRIPAEDVRILRGDVLHENEVTPDVVVAGGELTIHVLPRTQKPIPDPCIRCSWCVESCPVRIQPAGLLEASQRGNMTMAKHYGLDACIECGVCTYVCPSHLPLLTGIRNLREKARLEKDGPAQ